MYVCLCNGYRESELRDMARKGYTAAAEAYEAMGDGPCCGQCVDFAQEIINEERISPCASRDLAAGVAGDFDSGLASEMVEGAENLATEGTLAGSNLGDVTA